MYKAAIENYIKYNKHAKDVQLLSIGMAQDSENPTAVYYLSQPVNNGLRQRATIFDQGINGKGVLSGEVI